MKIPVLLLPSLLLKTSAQFNDQFSPISLEDSFNHFGSRAQSGQPSFPPEQIHQSQQQGNSQFQQFQQFENQLALSSREQHFSFQQGRGQIGFQGQQQLPPTNQQTQHFSQPQNFQQLPIQQQNKQQAQFEQHPQQFSQQQQSLGFQGQQRLPQTNQQTQQFSQPQNFHQFPKQQQNKQQAQFEQHPQQFSQQQFEQRQNFQQPSPQHIQDFTRQIDSRNLRVFGTPAQQQKFPRLPNKHQEVPPSPLHQQQPFLTETPRNSAGLFDQIKASISNGRRFSPAQQQNQHPLKPGNIQNESLPVKQQLQPAFLQQQTQNKSQKEQKSQIKNNSLMSSEGDNDANIDNGMVDITKADTTKVIENVMKSIKGEKSDANLEKLVREILAETLEKEKQKKTVSKNIKKNIQPSKIQEKVQETRPDKQHGLDLNVKNMSAEQLNLKKDKQNLPAKKSNLKNDKQNSPTKETTIFPERLLHLEATNGKNEKISGKILEELDFILNYISQSTSKEDTNVEDIHNIMIENRFKNPNAIPKKTDTSFESLLLDQILQDITKEDTSLKRIQEDTKDITDKDEEEFEKLLKSLFEENTIRNPDETKGIGKGLNNIIKEKKKDEITEQLLLEQILEELIPKETINQEDEEIENGKGEKDETGDYVAVNLALTTLLGENPTENQKLSSEFFSVVLELDDFFKEEEKEEKEKIDQIGDLVDKALDLVNGSVSRKNPIQKNKSKKNKDFPKLLENLNIPPQILLELLKSK